MPQLFAFFHFLFSLYLLRIMLQGIRLLCAVGFGPGLQLPTVECGRSKRMLHWLPSLYLSRLLARLRVAPCLPQRERGNRELQSAMEELLFIEPL